MLLLSVTKRHKEPLGVALTPLASVTKRHKVPLGLALAPLVSVTRCHQVPLGLAPTLYLSITRRYNVPISLALTPLASVTRRRNRQSQSIYSKGVRSMLTAVSRPKNKPPNFEGCANTLVSQFKNTGLLPAWGIHFPTFFPHCSNATIEVFVDSTPHVRVP